jgi:hypothetical protein
MPWTPQQAAEHNSRVKGSPKLQKQWAAVANDVLARELQDGTEQSVAEGKAIAAANAAVKKKPKALAAASMRSSGGPSGGGFGASFSQNVNAALSVSRDDEDDDDEDDDDEDEDEDEDELRGRRRHAAFSSKTIERHLPSGEVIRTIYTASGLVHHQDADITPASNLALAFEYCHQARLAVPNEYDQQSGPEVIEPGVRAQYAFNPHNPTDRQPVLYQFDSTRFSEVAANAWLAAHGARDFTFQPDTRDKAPVTQGSAVEGSERAPEGFVDINAFYASTIPVEASPDTAPGSRLPTVPAGSDRSRAEGFDDVTRTAGPHSFSSTQVNLYEPLKSKILALADKIPDEELSGDGRESEPHITVRYGLHTDDPRPVVDVLKDCAPIRYTLGAVSIFVVDDNDSQRGGDQYDVVKVDVESPGLVELNRRLGILPCTDTHPTYHPHVTIAYVKPGLGRKYAGSADFSKQLSAKASEVVFSNREGAKTFIPLAGGAS